MSLEVKQGLAADSIGLAQSIAIGIAGSAPAFSVSAATATLVAAIGTLAPASILYCGILMFGIPLAFIHLNKILANAGTSYAWVGKVFGPYWGFLAGWSILVSSAVFMVSGSIPAATATLLLIKPDLVNIPSWVAFTAAIWLTLISSITLKGIKASSYLQMLMTSIEILILLAVILGGAIQFLNQPAHHFSFAWLSFTGFTPSSFATGALGAVFLYWGWDVTLNLNEETKNIYHTPGRGAFWSVILVILLFVSFSIVALLVLSDQEIQSSGTNIMFAIANKIFPKPWGYLAVLAVILSSVGNLETTFMQFTRTIFAQGRDKVLHPRYAKLHTTWNTPWVAILFLWAIGMFLLLISSNFSTVSILIRDSVNVIGFQVAFYYSLTAFACAWYYRAKWESLFELLGYLIWPVVSGLFLTGIALLSIPTFDTLTNIVGLGGIGLGIVPFLWNHHTKS